METRVIVTKDNLLIHFLFSIK